ncbi:hypothetical protein DE146DRAFT_392088 [Phaeosphaeria sp. MPI-PUGE-AT-0046c]|nr:hypothetical protein DE146DRAFT_392088 [Phaeosphaeria sp. MPI-PUGE-AT-0046c]
MPWAISRERLISHPASPAEDILWFSFARLYAHIPTLNTRDKTSTDGAFPQALLAPPFVNITEFENPKHVRHNHLRSTHTLKLRTLFLAQVSLRRPARAS